jgi:CubicO group peptidase (beta-lactamase class C family)
MASGSTPSTLRTWSRVAALIGLAVCLSGDRALAMAPETDARSAKVDAVFASFNKPDSPGCAVSVMKDGAIVHAHGYGLANLETGTPITPASIFSIASISKQFTAMAVVLLARDGKLSLDDPVRKYVPELPEVAAAVTIRHLLTHTSGLREAWDLLKLASWRRDDLITERDLLDMVTRQRELNFKPGTEFLYNNTHYTLLAVIVRRVSGVSLRAFAEANIFTPLGMSHTHFHDDHTQVVQNRTSAYEPGPVRGAGLIVSVPVYDTVGSTGLMTSVEDLALWEANFQTGRVGGRAVLDQMLTPATLSNGQTLDYGFGLMLGTYKGLKVVEHSGADHGYSGHLLRFPDRRFAVACLCNVRSANASAFAHQIADIYLADQYQPALPSAAPSTTPAVVAEQELAAKTGLYLDRTSGRVVRLSMNAGKLTLQAGLARMALTPLDHNRFNTPGGPMEWTFEPAAAAGTWRIRERRGTVTTVLEAVTPATPDATALGAYEGTYFSPELDASFALIVSDGRLVVRRKKLDDRTLAPTYADAFTDAEIGNVLFTRDPQHRVTGFALTTVSAFTTGSIRNLRFVRQSR